MTVPGLADKVVLVADKNSRMYNDKSREGPGSCYIWRFLMTEGQKMAWVAAVAAVVGLLIAYKVV